MSWINREPPGLDPQHSETVRVVLLSRGDERLDPVWGLYRWDKASCEYLTTNISVRALTWRHALAAFEKYEAEQTRFEAAQAIKG